MFYDRKKQRVNQILKQRVYTWQADQLRPVPSEDRKTRREFQAAKFLPAREDKFDIVLSSCSLFELPNLKTRLETAHNLLNNLDLCRERNQRGFPSAQRDPRVSNAGEGVFAFIFSPCPHTSPCPRLQLNNGTPCNFPVSYNTFGFSGNREKKKDTFSYLVMKKGKSTEADHWREGIFTASKHGKSAYKCARVSRWGDRLTLRVLEGEKDDEESDGDSDDEKVKGK